ncbi:hypothetical protein DPMN_151940 [Dreissena polymorpha]|uniref:Uncharacterized protein n=1 Tax=Dreissena polymorpha TaxID=45954 RepID=A0A9D4FKG2_DREPO|nr:hypothetical protein DPMN_151940 [Dreissena polymorpha]
MPRTLVAMFFNQPEQFSNSSKISLGQIFGPSSMTNRQYMWRLEFKKVLLQPYKEKCIALWRQCVFKPTETIFELFHDIIGTHLLTKFHEDRTVNVASRLLTGHMLKPHNARRTTDKRRSQKLTMRTLRSVELKMKLKKYHQRRNSD